jgi:orotidine-5'-phosphate decarboxylase
VREATRLGVFMLTIHASGGLAMARAAADAATRAAAEFGVPRPCCLGVTVLTSLDRRALQREVGVPTSVEGHVLHLAGLAREANLDGCVASPQEIAALRVAMGTSWVIVTPGIRPAQHGASPAGRPDTRSDQVRVATPRRALAAGADYLVVGRPISAASDPGAAAAAIVAEISGS